MENKHSHLQRFNLEWSILTSRGIGFISYMRKLGMVFVLSDPVTAPENFEIILDCFHNRFRNASYIQVSKEVADILNEKFGLYGTQFGSDLASWTLSGKKSRL